MRTETHLLDATAIAIRVLEDYQWARIKVARGEGRDDDAEALALQTVIDDMERRRK